ncbi:MAG: phytoene/squalene synthase family protein, partial [Woeseia sp.]
MSSLTAPARMSRTDSQDGSCVAFQDRLLPGVSRTFALTIPQLPRPLCIAVTNAYLLCRIADTVEDDGTIAYDEKNRLQSVLLRVVRGSADPDEFADPCLQKLSSGTPAAERELIEHTSQVVSVTHGLSKPQRDAIQRCLKIMCAGMGDFARRQSLHGLPTMSELDRYCYVVAGCVGEMLTELFCDYSQAIAAQRSNMMPLAKSFGQGLQMTNILKDVWDDREHNACWLPRDVFAEHGLDVSDLPADRHNPALAKCIDVLIGIAREHLRAALEYTQLLPKQESGIRNFCLWAIGLAVLTLRNIHNQPTFASGKEVKVSRRALRAVIVTSTALAKSDSA